MSAEPEPAIDLDVIYNAAQVLAMKGLKLIRLRPGSKVPYDTKWPELATNSAATIDEWFAHGGDFNLGLACGLQPNGLNIVAIDIDPKNGGLETWRRCVEQHGRVGGPRHTTPNGGFHLPLIFPPGFRNTRNMLGPGIDTRGEGGQIVLPPSKLINFETGEIIGLYARALGLGLCCLDMIEAPEWMVETLSTPPVPTVRQSVERHPSQQSATETPLDFLRRTTDPIGVMVQRYDWQVHSVRGQDTYLTRPGKNPRDGHSAIVHGDGAIVVFTTTDVDHLVQRPTSDGTGIKMSLAEFIAAEEGIGLSELSRQIRSVMPPPVQAAASRTVPTEAAPESTEEGGSWSTPVDLTGFLDGTAVLDPPSILLRTDGVGLFYPGTINGIHGESGLGKGWVAVTAAAEVIRAGGVAVYVDLEDTPTSITTRLRNVGLTAEEIAVRLVYLRPQDPSSPSEIVRLVRLCRERQAALVVIDSLGEAFGLDSINEDKDNEVAPWLRQIPRALADTGACVLIVDHVTKTVDNPLYPKGSARKRAAVGGAAYLIEAVKPLTKGRGGKLRLTCAKDRYGFHSRGAVVAEMVFNPSGPDDMIVRIFPMAEREDERTSQERQDEQVAECAVEMIKVAKRRRAEFTKTSLVDGTAGYRAEIKRAAFDLLVEQRHIEPVGKGKFKVSVG